MIRGLVRRLVDNYIGITNKYAEIHYLSDITKTTGQGSLRIARLEMRYA
jgi:hypothetical protein